MCFLTSEFMWPPTLGLLITCLPTALLRITMALPATHIHPATHCRPATCCLHTPRPHTIMGCRSSAALLCTRSVRHPHASTCWATATHRPWPPQAAPPMPHPMAARPMPLARGRRRCHPGRRRGQRASGESEGKGGGSGGKGGAGGGGGGRGRGASGCEDDGDGKTAAVVTRRRRTHVQLPTRLLPRRQSRSQRIWKAKNGPGLRGRAKRKDQEAREESGERAPVPRACIRHLHPAATRRCTRAGRRPRWARTRARKGGGKGDGKGGKGDGKGKGGKGKGSNVPPEGTCTASDRSARPCSPVARGLGASFGAWYCAPAATASEGCGPLGARRTFGQAGYVCNICKVPGRRPRVETCGRARASHRCSSLFLSHTRARAARAQPCAAYAPAVTRVHACRHQSSRHFILNCPQWVEGKGKGKGKGKGWSDGRGQPHDRGPADVVYAAEGPSAAGTPTGPTGAARALPRKPARAGCRRRPPLRTPFRPSEARNAVQRRQLDVQAGQARARIARLFPSGIYDSSGDEAGEPEETQSQASGQSDDTGEGKEEDEGGGEGQARSRRTTTTRRWRRRTTTTKTAAQQGPPPRSRVALAKPQLERVHQR